MYDFFVPGHIITYNMPVFIEHLRLAGYDVEHGSFLATNGNLRARVKAFRAKGRSPYPEPMASSMKKWGRCTTHTVRRVRWPGRIESDLLPGCFRCGIVARSGEAVAWQKSDGGMWCPACWKLRDRMLGRPKT